jgi:hypothetical protein
MDRMMSEAAKPSELLSLNTSHEAIDRGFLKKGKLSALSESDTKS